MSLDPGRLEAAFVQPRASAKADETGSDRLGGEAPALVAQLPVADAGRLAPAVGRAERPHDNRCLTRLRLHVRDTIHLTQPVEQVVADPKRVGHRRQRRVDRPDAREDARVDDVEVVELRARGSRRSAPSSRDRSRTDRCPPDARPRQPGSRSSCTQSASAGDPRSCRACRGSTSASRRASASERRSSIGSSASPCRRWSTVTRFSASGRSSVESQKSIECFATRSSDHDGASVVSPGFSPRYMSGCDLPTIWIAPSG